MFPYEFNYPNVFKDNLYGNLLLILAALSIMIFYDFTSFKDVYSYYNVYNRAFINAFKVFKKSYCYFYLINGLNFCFNGV